MGAKRSILRACMAAMVPPAAASFSDNFNRANQLLDASANWTLVAGGGTPTISVFSNAAQASGTSSATATAYLSPDLGSQRQSVSCTALGTGGFVCVQLTDGNNFIGMRYYNGTTLQVMQMKAATLTLVCAFPDTVVSTDTMELRYISGTLTVNKNGASLTPNSGSLTVTSGPPASTRTGLVSRQNAGAVVCDDYTATTI